MGFHLYSFIIGVVVTIVYGGIGILIFYLIYDFERGKKLAKLIAVSAFWPFSGLIVAAHIGLYELISAPWDVIRQYKFGKKAKVTIKDREDLQLFFTHKDKFKKWLNSNQ